MFAMTTAARPYARDQNISCNVGPSQWPRMAVIRAVLLCLLVFTCALLTIDCNVCTVCRMPWGGMWVRRGWRRCSWLCCSSGWRQTWLAAARLLPHPAGEQTASVDQHHWLKEQGRCQWVSISSTRRWHTQQLVCDDHTPIVVALGCTTACRPVMCIGVGRRDGHHVSRTC